MIVISGALVLVALVLLVIGLVSTSLPFVYASIAVSVVSFVFLLIGILQRRGEQSPEAQTAGEAGTPATADVEGVTAIIPAGSRAAADPPAEPESESAQVSGTVLVVAGRPRYHVSGCRYLTGKDPDEVDVQSARDEGFTACGVCKPDSVLAEETAAEPHPQPDAEIPAAEPDEEPAAAAVPQPRGARAADPVKAARKTTRATPTKAPGRTPATSAAQPATKSAPRKAPVKTAAKAPSKAAAAAAASTPAAASASRTGNVVVIPDRGKYHKSECRYVRDVPEAEELSKAAARRQGYDACGVCKP